MFAENEEGVVRAGLEVKGQKVSKQDIRVEQKVSVALLASIYDNCLRGGSNDETIADSREVGMGTETRYLIGLGAKL